MLPSNRTASGDETLYAPPVNDAPHAPTRSASVEFSKACSAKLHVGVGNTSAAVG